MKLQAKMITLFTGVTLLLMLIFGSFFYSKIWHDRFNSLTADISNQLQHIDFTLNTFFTEVENDINSLASDESVRTRADGSFTNFLHADEKTFIYSITGSEQKIIDVFNNYQHTHSYVHSVYMGRENGSFVRSFKRERPTMYDPRLRPWYMLAKSDVTKVLVTEPYSSVTASDINIGIVKALVDTQGVFYGVVGADVTLVNLTTYISNITTNPAGTIILVDQKGNVLAGLKKEYLFKKIYDYAPDFQKLFTEPNMKPFSIRIKGEKNYVFFTTSTEYNWKLIIVIPAKSIEKQLLGTLILNISGQLLGLLLLSIFTFWGMYRYIVSPLKTLIKETNYIANTSDFNRSIRIISNDEIGELSKSYNEMLRTIRLTYKTLIDTKIDLIKHKNDLEDIVQKRTVELQETNKKLSMEIQERAIVLEELVAAKDHAEESDRLKSSFLATMSHELRTPLNSIIGFTGILLQGIAGPLNDEQRKQLQMVKSSAHHLLSLINEILDISKIQAGTVELINENFDLRQAIEKSVASLSPLAEKKGLTISTLITLESDEMCGDQQRVEQILLNLISNAIKFSENGSIKVECEELGDTVVTRVIDTGIGINAEDQKVLFKPFRQIDSGLGRKYEGTGLGLSICKELVERMSGHISIISAPGEGSTFIVSLPRKRISI